MNRVRLMWPIADEHASFVQLLEEASAEVPRLATQASARIIGPGRFTIARSEDVAGSGRCTTYVLLYEAAADPLPARAYHLGPA